MSNKYQVTVQTKRNGTLRPIINASTADEALRMAREQYPDAKVYCPVPK